MPPRRSTASENPSPAGRRRSSRIAEKPKSPIRDESAPKPPAKKGNTNSKKREADQDGAGESNENRKVKKAKEELNAEEQEDQLADDDDDGGGVENVQILDIGDVLPSITLRNEKDEDVNVAELAIEKGLVLFLVPKADTSSCTQQACGFRDSYPDFAKVDFDVYCLSADTVSAQAKWKTKKKLPYSLLSDRNRVLIKALGASSEANKTKRSHFVFEKGGKLVEKKIPVKPLDSPQQALDFIQKLQS